MFESTIETLEDATKNLSFKNVTLCTYVAGSAYIALASTFLIPTEFLFGALAILSIAILACNLVASARVKEDGYASVKVNTHNLFAGSLNGISSRIKWFCGRQSSEKIASEYNLNGNIAYSAITLVSMFVGINFLPVRLAAGLLYLTNISYIISISNNISRSPSRIIDTDIDINEKVLRVMADGFLFDNNPVNAFRVYGCGVAQDAVERAITTLSA